MLLITSHFLNDDTIGVQIEGRDSSEVEIRLAYEALAKVVDGLCDNNKEGGKENGQ